jgi:hypothetical protein
VAVEVVGNLSAKLFVHIVEHTAQKFLGVLLLIALERRIQLLDRPQDVFRCVIVRRNILSPVTLEPMRERHEQLLSAGLPFGGIRVTA